MVVFMFFPISPILRYNNVQVAFPASHGVDIATKFNECSYISQGRNVFAFEVI